MATVLSALLVSGCSQSLFFSERACRAHNVETTTCLASSEAAERLRRKPFELILLDFDLVGAAGLLALHPKDIQGYATTMIGLSWAPDDFRRTFGTEVLYWLEKPLSSDQVGRTLRAAYSHILSQKRIYFRHAVNIKASATFRYQDGARQPASVMIVDISHTGLCFTAEMLPPVHAKACIDFELPGTQQVIHAVGNVIWGDNGKTGMNFRFMQSDDFTKLREWLNAQCPWEPRLVEKAPAYQTIIGGQNPSSLGS
jgi:hypothetical protein